MELEKHTVVMAAAVTVTDAILAFPFAYFMARVASRRVQTILFAAVLLPLWASYIARVYSWILILNHSGLLNWSLQSIGLPPANIGYTYVAMWIVFSYIWLAVHDHPHLCRDGTRARVVDGGCRRPWGAALARSA